MRNLQNRPPSTQVRRADDLLNEAMQVLEQHREVTNEEDYNMERALLTSTRGFRNGEERDRSITAISYLDKAHKTLETVKQVTLESVNKIRGADASTVPTKHEHRVSTTGTITDSDAISNDMLYRARPPRLPLSQRLLSHQVRPSEGPHCK